MERLQKVLAQAGLASRRAAEQIILAGRVRVDGKIVRELGTQVDPRTSRVEVDGKTIVAEKLVYIVLHKPRGVVCTLSDPEGRPTIRELLKEAGARVVPVGRLDFHTSGALLCTNDGEFSQALAHPTRSAPKVYVAKVKGTVDDDALPKFSERIEIDGRPTQPAQVKRLRYEGDKTWLEITLREGRNRQVRRLGEATGFPVMRLARISHAGITSEDLRPGQWRPLTLDELVDLKKTYGVPKKVHAPHFEPAQGKAAKGQRRNARPDIRGELHQRPETRASRGGREPRRYVGQGDASLQRERGPARDDFGRSDRAPAGKGRRETRSFASNEPEKSFARGEAKSFRSREAPRAQPRAERAERPNPRQSAEHGGVRNGRAPQFTERAGERGRPVPNAGPRSGGGRQYGARAGDERTARPSSDRGPARSDRGPARSDRGPARSDRGPARSDRGPARADRGPARSDRGPVRSDRGPARSDRGPARSDGAPARNDRAPARADRDVAAAPRARKPSAPAEARKSTYTKSDEPRAPREPKRSAAKAGPKREAKAEARESRGARASGPRRGTSR